MDEVLYCDRINDEYIINAKYHKTASTYGRTKLALTKEEYLELEHFNRLQTAFPGFNSEVTTFFFNCAGGELEKMDETVTDVWEECGVLGGHSHPDQVNDCNCSIAHHGPSPPEQGDQSNVPQHLHL